MDATGGLKFLGRGKSSLLADFIEGRFADPGALARSRPAPFGSETSKGPDQQLTGLSNVLERPALPQGKWLPKLPLEAGEITGTFRDFAKAEV